MSRTTVMTTGILLVLIGIQLNLVESFVLTPRATNAWNNRALLNRSYETVPGNYIQTTNGYFRGSDIVASNNTAASGRDFTTAKPNLVPYSTSAYRRSASGRVPAFQANYGRGAVAGDFVGPQKMLTPPRWFCWPPVFLGTVVFLFGAATRE